MIAPLHIVSELLHALQRYTDCGDRYLKQIGEQEMINPLLEQVHGVHEASHAVPSEVLAELGIRCMTLTKQHEAFSLPREVSLPTSNDASRYKWHSFRNAPFLENLRSVLHDCQVIAFSDWAVVNGASQLWDGFLYDVIKPLKRHDLHFMFYLGDPTDKQSHEVDEIIDIISDFSAHGKVTFLLNEQEAIKLWMVLHGENPDGAAAYADAAGLLEKYRDIFNTMQVDRLLIYATDRVTAFSCRQQFELRSFITTPHTASPDIKDNFNAGYSLGLLLQLDIPHCVALGMTVSGAYLEHGTRPDRQAVLAYLERWLAELAAPDAHLSPSYIR